MPSLVRFTALPAALLACFSAILLPAPAAYALGDLASAKRTEDRPLSISLEDGLVINITNPVSCTRKTKKGDTVFMQYRGTLASNGQQFDSSYDRGRPFQFSLGLGQVIRGWDEGLLDMCVGEKRKLTIPPALGYGDAGAGGVIPGGATLCMYKHVLGTHKGARDWVELC